nr:MAG TPA: hypothetical protein [Caudoviricetes sp.]
MLSEQGSNAEIMRPVSVSVLLTASVVRKLRI